MSKIRTGVDTIKTLLQLCPWVLVKLRFTRVQKVTKQEWITIFLIPISHPPSITPFSHSHSTFKMISDFLGQTVTIFLLSLAQSFGLLKINREFQRSESPTEAIILPQLMTKPFSHIDENYVCLSISATGRYSCVEEAFFDTGAVLNSNACKRAWSYLDTVPVTIAHGERLSFSNPHRMWWLVMRRSFDLRPKHLRKGMKRPREESHTEVVGRPAKMRKTQQPLVLQQTSDRKSLKRLRSEASQMVDDQPHAKRFRLSRFARTIHYSR